MNIVLIEPEIPQNTGNIARTCAATQTPLHIVKPMGFTVDDKKLKRAGLDYWYLLDITYYENYAEFYEKHKDCELHFFTTKGKRVHSDVKYGPDAYLIFGKETAGIDEHILKENMHRCARIPMYSEARSLNLSNSVAVALYEALRQNDYRGLKLKGKLHHTEDNDI
ncbi:MAG: tRNA (uridine(34)/cytosine(34)/5-carboxymethylaminomethyluridine(34)-2'-O)-methyltransferase TrmL [Clostridia bacterium]|nr:tRNA (uridine(34)/cytosine(34)/5-carboxymethylaminomethyluridine(34)-2'-O)-methyltransferase TrmL [Clostridia bacterium]MBQ1376130.1 tRNA (uridine(34)/cytosine(34)/5-carboxymethylaminomethyluridine(34)-2'-O)-methyltransferase TrmL [Clostridia bacterium]MBQ1435378.1 tRNA (uridine(34)/cytosine(34)/5-carboxymethylaminomethyluridine(34)-2'-O)-methyltransferase TrmL [Clostridia bacterium]MBQ4248913.1 tRNA (uridine(34)/cytosine(34)/5-carboxymethylaminomethyluridine(34)-2'-O)-methyltransferase TrmL 